jgi:guanylate kinase
VTPRVVVLSAPSGGGKTTISRALLRRYPERFGYSVSATTRRPRAGERDGEAYHFLSREEFQQRRAVGEFLESAEYAGELYGTLKAEVARVLETGRHVLLDIEVHGARQVRATYTAPASLCIFVIPPTAAELIARLRGRGTESGTELVRRVRIAVEEIRTARQDVRIVYDRLVVNDDLERAIARVRDAVEHPGDDEERFAHMIQLLQQFLRDLEAALQTLRETS